MFDAAVMSAPVAASLTEPDISHVKADPLRTATGFVIGTALSGALWIFAGALAWYLT